MIRVLIERHLVPGMEDRFHEAMREMRREAVHRQGYISGETLEDLDDSRHSVILSTWQSRQDWEAWAVSDARQRVRQTLAAFLVGSETVTLLQPV